MTESMLPNETLQSQLSAFVDGELPAPETELLTRRLVREPELQHAMGRYLLMGEALRAPNRGRVSRDFSAKIAAAIEQADAKQPQLAEPVTTRKRSMLHAAQWLKPAAGIAVAASVALVAVLVVRAPPQATGAAAIAQQAAKSAAQAQLAANAINDESYVVPGVANVPSAPIPAARLTNYVVAHSQFTTPLGQRNMLMGLLSGDQAAADAKNADTPEADHRSTEKAARNTAGQ